MIISARVKKQPNDSMVNHSNCDEISMMQWARGSRRQNFANGRSWHKLPLAGLSQPGQLPKSKMEVCPVWMALILPNELVHLI
jgi:hypothetical protein